MTAYRYAHLLGSDSAGWNWNDGSGDVSVPNAPNGGPNSNLAAVNNYARQGWELIFVTYDTTGQGMTAYTFRRPGTAG